MNTPTHPAAEIELFAPVRAHFEAAILRALTAPGTEDLQSLEASLSIDGREATRLMLQASLDLRALRERAARTPPSSRNNAPRSRTVRRSIRSAVGLVSLARLAWSGADNDGPVVPMDSILNLVPERDSLEVRRLVAERVADVSFDRARIALREQGIVVAKRQAEQLVRRVAQDYEAFYEWGRAPWEEADVPDDTLLVMSMDGKGISMIPGGLRDGTRKAQQAASRDEQGGRGDPMAQRTIRPHTRRMAAVASVWDQPKKVRTVEAIVDGLQARDKRTMSEADRALPRPQNKRSWVLVEQGLTAMAQSVMDEAERRDPGHRRRWVVLVDGSVEQRDAVRHEAAKRGVRVTIVTDLIHVIHYVWAAGKALHAGDGKAIEAWVRQTVEKVLRAEDIYPVIAGIRQSATKRGLRGSLREALEKSAAYLEHVGPWLKYAAALAGGLPIATGVIEGACRSLVQDRMGITGARWSVETAEAVLRVRALIACGHWSAYLAFHAQQEHLRNHPHAPMAVAA